MGWKRTAFELATCAYAACSPADDSVPDDPRSIFVLRNNDLGDVLVITPLLEALKRRFPQVRIAVGVGNWAAPILEANPHVDAVLPVNAPWHNGQVSPQGLAAALRYLRSSPEIARVAAEHSDIGIDVLGSALGSLLLMRAGIPFRAGVRGYAGGHSAAQRCIAFDPHEHVGCAALRFAALLGATDLPENRPQLFLDTPSVEHGAVVMAPGGGFAEKCWPLTEFAALLESLAPRRVIVIGGQGDRDAGTYLAGGRTNVEDRTGQLSLRESFAMIAGASVVVCNSSMAMHAAAAFRKPCVVMLGPYFTDAAQHAAQWGYPETQVLGRSPGHPQIWTADEVWPILAGLLPPA